MVKPTAPQLRLMSIAHRNGGRLPVNSFAHYGIFRPYRGAEKVIAVLTVAAHIRDDQAAAQALLDRLDEFQLLMAGGFLDVDREYIEGRGTLAERYVKAIRAGRAEDEYGHIAPTTLHACIRHGWLDDKWNLTADGLAAGRAADHHRRFRPLHEITWRDRCYRRAVEINAAAPHMGDAADQLVAEDWDDAIEENTGRAGTELAGWTFTAAAGSGKSSTQALLDMARTDTAAHTTVTQLVRSTPADTAAAMAGYRGAELTPDEADAAGRGITPATYRRLTAPIAGVHLDWFAGVLTQLAESLSYRVADTRIADTLRRGVYDPEFRLALFEARRTADLEGTRMAAFHLEVAMQAVAGGHTDRVNAAIDKTRTALVKTD